MSSEGDDRSDGQNSVAQTGSRPKRPAGGDQTLPEEIEGAPEGDDFEEEGYSEVTTLVTSWSGPLPHPSTLEAFDAVVHNGAERIFTQFEKEAEHRRELESYGARRLSREKRVAQYCAAAFSFFALAVAAYALHEGAFVTAGVIGGGSIAMVVAAFLGTRFLGGSASPEDGTDPK
jgi:uncharacterized membrane protein